MGSLEESRAALELVRQEVRRYALDQPVRPFALVETTGYGEPKHVVAWGMEFPRAAKVFFDDGDTGSFGSAERAFHWLARDMFVELVYL